MKKFLAGLVELAVLTTTITAGVLVFGAIARGTAFGDGCANTTCLDILYYYDCPLLQGESLQVLDCLECGTGRCKNGRLVTCAPTNNAQGLASTNVTTVCDCKAAPKGTSVQANGNYGGPWQATTVNQYRCPN
jgi:hypothetical protein